MQENSINDYIKRINNLDDCDSSYDVFKNFNYKDTLGDKFIIESYKDYENNDCKKFIYNINDTHNIEFSITYYIYKKNDIVLSCKCFLIFGDKASKIIFSSESNCNPYGIEMDEKLLKLFGVLFENLLTKIQETIESNKDALNMI